MGMENQTVFQITKPGKEKVGLVLFQNPGTLCFEMSFLLQALGLGLQIRQMRASLMGSGISLFPPENATKPGKVISLRKA